MTTVKDVQDAVRLALTNASYWRARAEEARARAEEAETRADEDPVTVVGLAEKLARRVTELQERAEKAERQGGEYIAQLHEIVADLQGHADRLVNAEATLKEIAEHWYGDRHCFSDTDCAKAQATLARDFLSDEEDTRLRHCWTCGAIREESDMGNELKNGERRWFCHPFDAAQTTCYMNYVMHGSEI